MEETLEGGRGPPQAVAPLEGERDIPKEHCAFVFNVKEKFILLGLLFDPGR
jgi:hypothetical protein